MLVVRGRGRSARPRALLAAAGALLVLAGGDAVVGVNLGEFAARDPGLTRAILTGARADLADLALLENGLTHHQADLVLLARLAPRARYVLVDVPPDHLVPALLGVADAREVVVDGTWTGRVLPPADGRVWRGASRLGAWEVRAGPGRPDTFLVVADPADAGRTVFLDAALPTIADPGPGGRAVVAGGPGPDPTRPPVAREVLLLLALTLLGGLVLPRDLGPALDRRVRPAAALLVGVALPALPAGLAVATGLRWTPVAAWTVMLGVVLIARRTAARHGPVGWRLEDVGTVLPTVAAVTLAVAVVHTDGLVAVSPDAFQHLTRAAVLAAGAPDLLTLAPRTLAYRMVATSGLHALGVPLGLPVLLGAGAAVGLATLVVLAGAVRRMLAGRAHPAVAIAAAIAAAAIVATSERMLAMALYPNAHLLVAGGLLLLVLLRTGATPHPTGPAEAALVLLLALARPEGGLLAGLALLPGLARRVRDAPWPWAVLGGTVLVWQTVVVRAERAAGVASDPTVLVGAVVVGVLAVTGRGVLRVLGRPVRRGAASLAAALLWTVVAVLAARSEIVRGAIASAAAVLVDGTSGWGGTFTRLGGLVLLGAVAVVVAAALAVGIAAVGEDGGQRSTGRAVRPDLRLPPALADAARLLAGALPLLVLTSELRGSAFHTGQGDSLVRMWTHLVPLLVLLAVGLPTVGAAGLRSALRWRGGRAPSARGPAVGPSGRAARPTAPVRRDRRLAVQAVALVVLAGLPWLGGVSQPLPDVVLPVTAMTPEDAVRATDELLTGTVVRGALAPSPTAAALHAEGTGRVCLQLLTATYLRDRVAGAWDVALRLGPVTDRVTVDVAEVRDTEFLARCLPGLTPRDLAAGVLGAAAVEVRTTDGRPGTAAGLWLAADGAGGEVPVHRLEVLLARTTVVPGVLRALAVLVVVALGALAVAARRRSRGGADAAVSVPSGA